METPTVKDIAENKQLWEEYVDPDNNDPGAFDRMTVEERIAAQRQMFPAEAAEEDAANATSNSK